MGAFLVFPLLVPLQGWAQAWQNNGIFTDGGTSENAELSNRGVIIRRPKNGIPSNFLRISPVLFNNNQDIGIGLLTNGYLGYLSTGVFGRTSEQQNELNRWSTIGDRLFFDKAPAGLQSTGLRVQWNAQNANFSMINRPGTNPLIFGQEGVNDGLIEWGDELPKGVGRLGPRTMTIADAGAYSNFRFIFQNTNFANATDTRNEVMTLNGKGQVGIANPAPFGKFDVFQLDDPEISTGIFSYMNNSARKRGGDFVAVQGSNASVVGKDNFSIGVQGFAGIRPGDESDAKEQINIGVRGSAYGTGRCYGVYGDATFTGLPAQSMPIALPAGSWAGYFNGDAGGLALYLGSGKNLKTKIAPIPNSKEILEKLSPKTYFFKDSKELKSMALDTKRKQYGLIAEEVEAVLPELVKENVQFALTTKDGKEIAPAVVYKMVNYIGLIPILIDAVNTQSKEIAELKSLLDNEMPSTSENAASRVGIEIKDLLKVIPNPNKGKFDVKPSGVLVNIASVFVLTDLTGKQITSQALGDRKVANFENVPLGVYQLFGFLNGKELGVSKVLVQ